MHEISPGSSPPVPIIDRPGFVDIVMQTRKDTIPFGEAPKMARFESMPTATIAAETAACRRAFSKKSTKTR
jgi:hypothetical protein